MFQKERARLVAPEYGPITVPISELCGDRGGVEVLTLAAWP